MKHLIQQWLNDEIGNEIEVDGRVLTLEHTGDRYEVWEDGELIAWNDNHRDFLEVGSFIDIEEAAE